MYENAQEIFDYLPINRNKPEADYIDHLWNAFVALDNTENSARSFSVMPFHLLFMLAIQYKGIRIAKMFPEAADLFFAGVGGRNKDTLLNPRKAVFDLALINERTLPELFRLVGSSEENIQKTKNLIDDRNNNLAHAKGGIELDPDERIEQYLDVLRTLQPYLMLYNDRIAYQWLEEISPEDVLTEFIDTRLHGSQLSQGDFKSGALLLFNIDEATSVEEWQATIQQLLRSNYSNGETLVRQIGNNHPDLPRRLIAVQLLSMAGKLHKDFSNPNLVPPSVT